MADVRERNNIICSPWAERVPGVASEKVSCDRCRRNIAVSTATRNAVEDPRFVCERCALIENPGGVPELLEATRAEIEAATGVDVAPTAPLLAADFARAGEAAAEGEFRARRRARRRRA